MALLTINPPKGNRHHNAKKKVGELLYNKQESKAAQAATYAKKHDGDPCYVKIVLLKDVGLRKSGRVLRVKKAKADALIAANSAKRATGRRAAKSASTD